MEIHKQQIRLTKDGNKHDLYYENDEDSFHVPLERDEYTKVFEKIRPNFSFATPDLLVQDNVNDGSVVPSFSNGNLFNREDMHQLLKKAKEEMNYIVEFNKNCGDKKRDILKNCTKKNRDPKPRQVPKRKPNGKRSTNKPNPRPKAKPKARRGSKSGAKAKAKANPKARRGSKSGVKPKQRDGKK